MVPSSLNKGGGWEWSLLAFHISDILLSSHDSRWWQQSRSIVPLVLGRLAGVGLQTEDMFLFQFVDFHVAIVELGYWAPAGYWSVCLLDNVTRRMAVGHVHDEREFIVCSVHYLLLSTHNFFLKIDILKIEKMTNRSI